MERMRVRFTGTTPLMMNNGQTAHPLNPFALKLSALNKTKKRHGADKEKIIREMAEVEFRGSQYYDERTGPYIPTAMIMANLVQGAKLYRGGTTVTRSVMIRSEDGSDKVALKYDGPRDIEKLAADPKFRDERMVKVGQARVPRTRAFFPEWGIGFTIVYNPAGIDGNDLRTYLEAAGVFEGLGDGRGKLGFGRFDTEILESSKKLSTQAA